MQMSKQIRSKRVKKELKTIPYKICAELTELTDFCQLLLYVERRKTALGNLVYGTLFKTLFLYWLIDIPGE